MIRTLVLIAIIALVAASSSSSGEGEGEGGAQPTSSRTAADLDTLQTTEQNTNGVDSPTTVIYPGIFVEFEMEKNSNTKFYTEVFVESYDFSDTFNQLELLVCPKLGTGSAAAANFQQVGGIGNWDSGSELPMSGAKCQKKVYALTSGTTGKVARIWNQWRESTLSKTHITVSARVVDSQGNDYAPALIVGKTTVKYDIDATRFQNFRVFTDQKVVNFVIGVGSPLTQTIQAYMYTEEVTASNIDATTAKNVGWKVEDGSATKGQICTGNVLDIRDITIDGLMYLGVKGVTDVKGVTVTYKDTLDCSSASSVSALVALVVVVAKFFF